MRKTVVIASLFSLLLLGTSAFSMTSEHGEESEQQTAEPRVRSISGGGFAFGAAWPLSDALLSHKTMFAFGANYLLGIERVLIEFRSDVLVGRNDIQMETSSFSTGIHYVWLNKPRIASYTGIDLGFAHVEDVSTKSRSGLGVAGNVGLLLFRDADINLDLRFRTMMLADKLNGKVPVIGTFLIGVLF